MQANTDKTKYMEIYFGPVPPTLQPIVINDSEIDQVTVFKLFCPMIENKLSWDEHVEYLCGKTSKRIYFLILLKRAGRSPSGRTTNRKPPRETTMWNYHLIT